MDLNYENNYLISMTPADRIIEVGAILGLNEKSNVLDLCCGYGEMLKLWAERFNIKGVGVDLCSEYIDVGTQRLIENHLQDRIILKVEDAQNYTTDEKFDVACLCGVGELFGGIDGHISMLEKFVKPTGRLIIAECFLNTTPAPRELIDFEGTLYTLNELYKIISARGWYISYFSTGTDADWERYISWDARRTIEGIRKNPESQNDKDWLDKWYNMYFQYRRQYEGWGFFALERI